MRKTEDTIVNEQLGVSELPVQIQNSLEVLETKAQLKVLICQKSGCQKKGSNRQHQALAAILRNRALQDYVVFQETDCLGKCSLAPNIILMPGNKRLSGMSPEAIATLLESLISNSNT